MSNLNKNLTIKPATDSNGFPSIQFTGKDGNDPITLRVTDDGSLSFEGSRGQLFSLNDDFTGTLFAANDVSGIPSIDAHANGEVRLAPYSGRVFIGTSNAFDSSTQTGTSDVCQIKGDVSCDGELRATQLGVHGFGDDIPTQTAFTGTPGQIRFDSSYIYVCTSSNNWKRVALTTF